MQPPPDALQPSAPVAELPWREDVLDIADAEAVRAYEESLFQAFEPILQLNPLVRKLWDWDEPRRRLRTRVPYAGQFIALMREARTGAIAYSVATNLHPDRFWQSGAYAFPPPAPEERACEFLIMANGEVHLANGATIVRHFIRDYFFAELRRRGYRCAYATSADHLRPIYRRFGGAIAAENTIDTHRRTLFRWDLDPSPPPER